MVGVRGENLSFVINGASLCFFLLANLKRERAEEILNLLVSF